MFLSIISLLFVLYLIAVAFFLVLENRRPQSTYAWLLAFVAFPVIGFLLYVFLGRGWKLFSQEKKLARNAIGDEFAKTLKGRLLDPDAIAQRLEEEKPGSLVPESVTPGGPQCRVGADRL